LAGGANFFEEYGESGTFQWIGSAGGADREGKNRPRTKIASRRAHAAAQANALRCHIRLWRASRCLQNDRIPRTSTCRHLRRAQHPVAPAVLLQTGRNRFHQLARFADGADLQNAAHAQFLPHCKASTSVRAVNVFTNDSRHQIQAPSVSAIRPAALALATRTRVGTALQS